MIDWLKGISKSALVAVLAFFAAYQVVKSKRAESAKRKWQEKSVTVAQSNVANATEKAEAAMTQAKVKNMDAKIAKEKARKKLDAIGKTDPDMASLVSGWKSARLRTGAAESVDST